MSEPSGEGDAPGEEPPEGDTGERPSHSRSKEGAADDAFDLPGFAPQKGGPPPPKGPPRRSEGDREKRFPRREGRDFDKRGAGFDKRGPTRPGKPARGGGGEYRRGPGAPGEFRRGPGGPGENRRGPEGGFRRGSEGSYRGGSDRGPSGYGPRGEAGRTGFRGPTGPGAGFDSRMAPEIRKLLPLKTEKGRHQAARFLIEGAKHVADAAELAPESLRMVYLARDFSDLKLVEELRRRRVPLQEAHPRDLEALSDTETPQGIIAVADFAALRPNWNAASYVVLIDGVQDPGNVGAILRTSAALGLDAVVLGKGTCDAYNPKVVRAAAGALLRLPLETGEDLAAKIHFLRTKGFSVLATTPLAKLTLAQAKLRKKVALLFGNEGAGVGKSLLDLADATVRIPMRGKVESLNVAVSHGLLTYELLRARGEL